MYKDELAKAMNLLAVDDRVLFLGQSVKYAGQTMTPTLRDVPASKKLELPIMEDAQLGLSIGLSLEGFVPVSLFSRFDFLILACNQLVNHLDKIEELSRGHFKPKVIIRTIVGSTKPLYPGPQHCQDHTEGLRRMLTNVDVVKLTMASEIVPAYTRALEREGSTLLVEEADRYND